MNYDATIKELHRELDKLNQSIAILEKLSQVPPRVKSTRGRKSMGYEERLEVSLRMRRYWANRRQAPKG